MAKFRVLILISTFIIVGLIGVAAIMYARGYRLSLNEDQISIGPTGILVANSDPRAAQVFINGELRTATDNTISLSPDTYDIVIKKEGYLPWEKRIVIEKEVVTQIDAYLLPSAPSLTAMTFSGAENSVVNDDNTRVAYTVPLTPDNIEKAGLWVIESSNLPLGFNRDPRQVTDGDLTDAKYVFSPDGRQILLTLGFGNYLLDTSTFTPQSLRVNITSRLETILSEWQEERENRLNAQIAPLPDEIESVFARRAANVHFSPDENRILYTASGSAELATGLVQELPGSSTQTEERTLIDGKNYVYDIREDKNFAVGEPGEVLYWLPNSLNLVKPLKESITILDYDGTNQKTIFSGGYEFPHAYATTNTGRILILTSFARADGATNLYWLSIK